MAGNCLTQAGVDSTVVKRPTAMIVRCMRSSLCGSQLHCFDHVSHEATVVPVCFSRLDFARKVCAADHEGVIALGGQRDTGFPLAETVFAIVLAERGGLPSVAAIGRDLD